MRTYVVGARTIRSFDPRWPEEGAVAHHTVGVAPFVLRDFTVVNTCAPPHLLVLDAKVRPLGTARITFLLKEDPVGTLLSVEESPLSGLFALPILRQITGGLIRLRNVEMCRRLRKMVDRREAQRIASGA